jgi:hypothetical protein
MQIVVSIAHTVSLPLHLSAKAAGRASQEAILTNQKAGILSGGTPFGGKDGFRLWPRRVAPEMEKLDSKTRISASSLTATSSGSG